MHPTRTRLALSFAGVAALAALTGCAGSGSDGGDSAAGVPAADVDAGGDVGMEAPADVPERNAEYADSLKDTANDMASVVDGVDTAKEVADVETDKAIISTGSVSLEAEDVGKARFDVRKVLDSHRGTISEQETTTGDEGEVATARLVVRVPSAEFGDAMDDLEGIATLLGSNESGQDVTTKVIDVAARIRAQRASVARVEALLDRAIDLQEVISIERQLATRQAELDSLVTRQKYLADQTSQSTIAIAIEQPADEEADDEEETTGFLGGLEDGWDSFVSGGAAALTVVGFVIPWALLAGVVGTPVWLALKRRRRTATAPAPAAAG